MEINHFQNRRNKSTFMKVSSIVLSMLRSDPGMSVRAAPSTPLSIKSIAPGCVNSRFVKYEVYLGSFQDVRLALLFEILCIYWLMWVTDSY